MKAVFLAMVGITAVSLIPEYISAQLENPNIRIDDPSFLRESLQTGETISPQGTLIAIIIQALGAIVIVGFIIIYAIKKRLKKDPK